MDLDSLRAAEAAGEPLKYLHFWGHTEPADGAVGRHVLSQWWPAAFTVEGVSYATAEHFMMAGKARLFADADAERAVLAADHPSQAKNAGRLVQGFDDVVWAAHREQVVVAANVAKFGQHPELGRYLLGTGSRVLVEASPRDRIWGIGLTASDPRAGSPATWQGLNLLGFALMAARELLRSRA